jgi:hypothetical protein
MIANERCCFFTSKALAFTSLFSVAQIQNEWLMVVARSISVVTIAQNFQFRFSSLVNEAIVARRCELVSLACTSFFSMVQIQN